eukprot:COSAG05_NODE_3982_length_1740_cov_1.569165_3_plen_82_part_00
MTYFWKPNAYGGCGYPRNAFCAVWWVVFCIADVARCVDGVAQVGPKSGVKEQLERVVWLMKKPTGWYRPRPEAPSRVENQT